jgi:hypothetical protein
MARIACGLPRRQLVKIWNGYNPERSGDIQFVPKAPNYMGDYLSHAGPWEYLQRVPMLWYGPGHVPARGSVDDSVTMADVAPTIARFLRFDFRAPDGHPMKAALPPAGQEGRPPRVVLAVVWDAGGRNVLAEHPNDWPNLQRLIPRGVWYEAAVVGSSPSHTAPIHATLGTGAFPATHGRIDGVFELDGRAVRPEVIGPRDLLVPTLADVYDRAKDNVPRVSVVGATPWHLGMAGQGSYFDGGDTDIGVLQTKDSWGLEGGAARYFQAPEYITTMPGYPDLIRSIDGEDGLLDGSWYGERFVDGANLLRKHTTIDWQTRIMSELVSREGFGKDDVPDLMFVNYKQIDAIGHGPSMNSPDMGAVVRRTDAALGELVRLMNKEVGTGEWMMVLTADHGSTPKPSVSGGFPISMPNFGEDLRDAFDEDGDDRDILLITRISQLWLDHEEMADNGVTLEQVSRWILRYTAGENVTDPSSLPPGRASQRVFAAAFPGQVLADLPCLPQARK